VKHEGLVAVQSQSYGPEARGGATRSDVILSHKAIHYPKVEQPNVLVALTDTACGKYLPLIRPGGLCVYDTDLVHPGRRVEARFKGIPLWSTLHGPAGRIGGRYLPHAVSVRATRTLGCSTLG